MFFLVSGAAAAGKSMVAKNIATRLKNLECHDYNEKKVVDEYTRCEQLEKWIKLALKCQKDGQDFLLTSHSPLGELLACPSARKVTGISACLLDCSDQVRISRMRKRGIDPRWPPTQDVLNWASWHRMHAWDPQWEQHVIRRNGPSDHEYERWINWGQTDTRWRVKIVDTTKIDKDQVLDFIESWVNIERGKTPLLSPDTKWWVHDTH